MSQAEPESLFSLWVGFQLDPCPDPSAGLGHKHSSRECVAGSEVPFSSSTRCSLSKAHRLMPPASQGDRSTRPLGPRVSELSPCTSTRVAVRVSVLPRRHNCLHKRGSWDTGDLCPALARFHLAAIRAFFPFVGPALETTLSSSRDMFGSNKAQEQCLIFGLPFVVTFAFIQPLRAPVPIGPSGAREVAAGRKSPKDIFALST